MAIDLKLFDGMVIFTQVINDGSFTAAAESTGHSTSFISKEVTKLETRLGVRLLQRTTRSISLTPEGKVFYQHCQQLIADAEQATALINQSHVTPKGHLKISCPSTFGLQYLQPLLSEYMQLYPEVTLELDFSNRFVDIVQEGFDLAIRASAQLEDSSLVAKKLKSYKAYTVASHDYLKKHGTPVHPKELVNHQCICYSNLKTPNRWNFTAKDKSALDKSSKDKTTVQVEVPNTLMCNSAEMEVAMVIAGHGICQLPEFYIEKELKEQKLAILFTDYQATNIDVFAMYPSRKHLSSKVRALLELLADKIPDSLCPPS